MISRHVAFIPGFDRIQDSSKVRNNGFQDVVVPLGGGGDSGTGPLAGVKKKRRASMSTHMQLSAGVESKSSLAVPGSSAIRNKFKV